MDKLRAQIVPESVIVVILMTTFLLLMYMVNQNLEAQSTTLKQQMQASNAANQMASAINRVAAGGNGTQVSFFNSVGQNVFGMEIFDGRSLRAYYGANDYVSVPLATNNTRTNLVAYWRFDSVGSTAYDSSGYGNTGAVSGAPAWTSNGKYGGAYTFNGKDPDFITAPAPSNPFTNKQGTFAAWVNYAGRSINNTQGIMNHVWGGATDNRIYARWDLGGRIEFQPTAYNVKSYSCANASLALNTWRHMAVTSYESGGTLYADFYIDGQKRCSFSDPVTATLYFNSGTKARVIGQVQNDATYKYFFNGTIDDVRIYNRALSDQEILALYKSNSGAIPQNQQVYISNLNGTVSIIG